MVKKSPKQQQQPTEEIQMADKDVMIIIGVKVKYLFLKENEHGHNHFFNVLDIIPLQDLVESRKSLKMTIWYYNGKCYVSQWFNKIESYLVKLNLKKMFLILWIKPFRNTTLRRMVSRLLVIVFVKLIKFIKLLYI